MGVFSLTGWARQIHTGLLVSRTTQDTAMSSYASNTGLSPSMASLSRDFFSHARYNNAVLQHQQCIATSLVWALPHSLATTKGIIKLFSFPRGTKMFQFPRLASWIYHDDRIKTVGLSHSEIPGSKVICTYPRLIAAYHVLHRLHEPRHPPCALHYFLIHDPLILQGKIPSRKRIRCSYFQLYKSSSQQKRGGGKTQVNKLSLLYCFACINMSKNGRTERRR